jgi:hypothetical protein
MKMVLFRIKFRWFLVFMALSACVDRISFDVPPAQSLMVVDGMISDAPGPYTVKLSNSFNISDDSATHFPVTKAKVTLFDDQGNSEDFKETSAGEYTTGGVLQGAVGHSYYIHIETAEGNIFESSPDQITSGGEVENIKFQFQANTIKKPYGDEEADVFNIFVDANAPSGIESYVRWRFTGIYKIVTNPELRVIWSDGGTAYMDPSPCSGYEVFPATGGGKLTKVGDCTCCTCWINDYETIPHLSDGQLVSENQFRNVNVGQIPINRSTFSDKYMVVVDQMSMTKSTFDFFKVIRSQKEGATSLFQPPYGEIRGNIKAVNSNISVVGIFWATSVKTAHAFLLKSDLPYILPPMDLVTEPCTSFSNSTTTQPAFWQ